MQIADILTKDLDKILHKKHRDVLFGVQPIQIVSLKLPESQKVYCRRHNEEIERRQQTQILKAEFDKQEVTGVDDNQVLLALPRVLANPSKVSHWKLKRNQALQALSACLN